jgi:hypothetical protein
MTLYGRCDRCKKKRFFPRKRSVFIPKLGVTATSKDRICNKCFTPRAKKALETNA